MRWWNRRDDRRTEQPGGWLRRLARDRAGNTLAMMAAVTIPLAALTGSAVDMARLYVVKVRLQQACDAGALAGRKFMAYTNSATLDDNAATQARTFFANNFSSGYMGTPAFTPTTTPYPFTPTKTADNQVAGTANVDVPMTLMKMFGTPTQNIAVTCQARYDVADTDIVFVLDTTGSMSCLPSEDDPTCTSYVNSAGTTAYTRPADSSLGAGTGSTGSANDSVAGYPGSKGFYVPEKNGSRIAALRQAVVNFYTTVASNADPSTHIRYGFVTYTSTVNAGKGIMNASPSYMVGGSGSGTTQWTYQSRSVNADYTVSSPSSTQNTSQTACNNMAVARNPSTPLTYNPSNGQATETKTSWSGGTCTITNYVYGPQWKYQPVAFDVSSFLTNASVTDPSRVDGSTAQWQGCIEERDTTPGVMSFSQSSLPGDLDPDLIPSSTATRWRPMWTEVVYGRNYNGSNTVFGSSAATTSNGEPTSISTAMSYWNYSQNGQSNYLLRSGWSTCGKPIRRVSTMTAQDVTNYVNASDFRPIGGTYHDTGMIWGVRMLSPNGIFASDTAAWPGRQPPNRVIVFLTDGAMAPALSIYGMYGQEYFDKRVTGGDYNYSGNPNPQLTAYHNARFLAECTKAKSLNINVWTVMITTNSSPTAPLSQCATSTNQALVSSSGSDLNTKFQAIAQQVARLRISQ